MHANILKLSIALTFFVSSGLASTNTFEEQQQTVMEFYNAVLSKPIKIEKYNDLYELHYGQTESGEVCGVHTSGSAITMMVHPKFALQERSYNDLQFDWNPMDLDSNILGIKVKPQFRSTSTSLEATVTFPVGHGLNKMGLRIQIKPGKSRVSIRNRTSLFLDNYYDCIFTK